MSLRWEYKKLTCAVREAFKTVLKDEQAGGNVSGLLTTLNEDGSLLAQAEIA